MSKALYAKQIEILICNLKDLCSEFQDQRIGIAVSGGADSIFLLHVLAKITSHVMVFHVNHQTRKECDQEAVFVQKYSKMLGVECKVLFVENLVLDMADFENQARKARYALLKNGAHEHNVPCILTAHHQNDLVETVFFKLFRGNRNVFIPRCRLFQESTIKLIRPMLHMQKRSILKYLQECQQSYIEDGSNNNTKYRRNFIRHKVMPLLEVHIPNLCKQIQSFSDHMWEEEEFLRKYTKRVEQHIFSSDMCKVSLFKKEDRVIQSRLLQNKCAALFNIQLTKKQLKNIVDILGHDLIRPIVLYSSNKNRIVVENGWIIFISENQEKNIEKKIIILHNEADFSLIDNWCVKKSIGWGLLWKEGDKIVCRSVAENDQMEWGKGRKRVRSLLKDKKIPLSLRKQAMVIEKNNDIVGILAFNFVYIIKSECAKSTDSALSFVYQELK